MEMVQQPVLHVEARVKTIGDGIIVRTDLVETPPSGFSQRVDQAKKKTDQRRRDAMAH